MPTPKGHTCTVHVHKHKCVFTCIIQCIECAHVYMYKMYNVICKGALSLHANTLYRYSGTPLYIRPEESVLFSELSLFQGLKSTKACYPKSCFTYIHVERKKVSRLGRWPCFRGVSLYGDCT